jgi:hypothetical protein
MHKTTWILLDTETTGLAAPIFVVELAAQRMRGWQADGEAGGTAGGRNQGVERGGGGADWVAWILPCHSVFMDVYAEPQPNGNAFNAETPRTQITKIFSLVSFVCFCSNWHRAGPEAGAPKHRTLNSQHSTPNKTMETGATPVLRQEFHPVETLGDGNGRGVGVTQV